MGGVYVGEEWAHGEPVSVGNNFERCDHRVRAIRGNPVGQSLTVV